VEKEKVLFKHCKSKTKWSEDCYFWRVLG